MLIVNLKSSSEKCGGLQTHGWCRDIGTARSKPANGAVISQARGPPLYEDFDAQIGEDVKFEPD